MLACFCLLVYGCLFLKSDYDLGLMLISLNIFWLFVSLSLYLTIVFWSPISTRIISVERDTSLFFFHNSKNRKRKYTQTTKTRFSEPVSTSRLWRAALHITERGSSPRKKSGAVFRHAASGILSSSGMFVQEFFFTKRLHQRHTHTPTSPRVRYTRWERLMEIVKVRFLRLLSG